MANRLAIPAEAQKAAESALCGGGEEQLTVHVTHEDVARRALEAAAPLIVAAAMEDYAKTFWSDSWTARNLRERAAELRGGESR